MAAHHLRSRDGRDAAPGWRGAALWAFGRYPGRTTLWERLALIALAVASIQVMRNALFFALLALLVLPWRSP